jgi:hypothetical protein
MGPPDPTVDPRWGRVGKQKIIDEGPLPPQPMPNINFSERCVTTCIRVGFTQTKNGLFCCLALAMNSKVLSRMTSSTVSMLYLHRIEMI